MRTMNDDHFNILLNRYLDGGLDADGMEEFERYLLSDRRARTVFWREIKLDAALGRLGGESWGRLLAATGKRRLRHWLRPALAAAAVLAFVAVPTWLAIAPKHSAGVEVEAPTATLSEPTATLPAPSVAVIRETTGAMTADGREFRVGETIGNESLKLRAGSMQITLFSGTRLMLEGPTLLDFTDESTVVLQTGALRAEVPDVTDRFLLVLPGARIEAGASELAAWAGADGMAEVRIDAGTVWARPHTGGGERLLDRGNYTLDADGRIDDGEDSIFPRHSRVPEAMGKSIGERQQLAFDQWRRTSDARVGDDSLLLYLRLLASEEPMNGLLPNEGGHEAASPAAVLVSGNWVDGRWPAKKALLFQSVADRVRFRIKGSHSKLSFSAWIQPWGFENALNALVMSQWDIPGEVHWQFADSGDLRFGVRPSHPSADGRFHRVFAESMLPPADRGDWTYLATTYDADARLVIHYLNGLEVKRGRLPESIPLAFGHATIGNVTNPPPDVWGSRSFGGALDELAIFSRVLEPQEILRLHEEGTPYRAKED